MTERPGGSQEVESGNGRYQGEEGALTTWAFSPLAIISALWTGERSSVQESGQGKCQVGIVPLAVSK